MELKSGGIIKGPHETFHVSEGEVVMSPEFAQQFFQECLDRLNTDLDNPNGGGVK